MWIPESTFFGDRESAQQPREQLTQQDSVPGTHLGELHAHPPICVNILKSCALPFLRCQRVISSSCLVRETGCFAQRDANTIERPSECRLFADLLHEKNSFR